MSQIKLITFDLDDTFWDIKSVIISAEKNSRAWLGSRVSKEINWGSFEDFMSIRQELIKDDPRLTYDLGLLRQKTIYHHLKDHIHDHHELEQLVDEAYKFFLKERHKVVFFDQVLNTLEVLAKNYTLGVLTNGNADIHKLGIGHLFNFSISSIDVQNNKPDPAHFKAAKEISGIDYSQTLHVGDDPLCDIQGARNLGINTMWFNLNGLVWDADNNPPNEFNHWSEFTRLLSLHYEQ
ncbi:HAD family hydrolase [Gammaproteobacteria bacterium]|nr:HAD family hydrolase [Gammaproteobacteria bacterium]MDA9973740.1 HAD family hydrolase [Gammaproteobacteria bacterium]